MDYLKFKDTHQINNRPYYKADLIVKIEIIHTIFMKL